MTETFSPRQEGRMNENRDVTSCLPSEPGLIDLQILDLIGYSVPPTPTHRLMWEHDSKRTENTTRSTNITIILRILSGCLHFSCGMYYKIFSATCILFVFSSFFCIVTVVSRSMFFFYHHRFFSF